MIGTLNLYKHSLSGRRPSPLALKRTSSLRGAKEGLGLLLPDSLSEDGVTAQPGASVRTAAFLPSHGHWLSLARTALCGEHTGRPPWAQRALAWGLRAGPARAQERLAQGQPPWRSLTEVSSRPRNWLEPTQTRRALPGT